MAVDAVGVCGTRNGFGVAGVCTMRHIYQMAYEVEVTDEWQEWFGELTAGEQEEVAATIGLLERLGPHLPFPYSSGVTSSRHSHMRELRTQVHGRPYRILYAFDPRRVAILLIAGDKTGNDRWYEFFVPRADDLYDEHLKILEEEGLI
jgi:hypothetical protein